MGTAIEQHGHDGDVKMEKYSLDRYQAESRRTWQLVHMDHPIVYPTMGLVNEAGELAGKVKKIFGIRMV